MKIRPPRLVFRPTIVRENTSDSRLRLRFRGVEYMQQIRRGRPDLSPSSPHSLARNGWRNVRDGAPPPTEKRPN